MARPRKTGLTFYYKDTHNRRGKVWYDEISIIDVTFVIKRGFVKHTGISVINKNGAEIK